jgi:hypothetical protein
VEQIRASIASRNLKEFDAYDTVTHHAAIEVLKTHPPKIIIGHAIIVGDTASFRVEGSETSGETATGSIKMILEDGKWKVLEDKWQVAGRQ